MLIEKTRRRPPLHEKEILAAADAQGALLSSCAVTAENDERGGMPKLQRQAGAKRCYYCQQQRLDLD